MRFQYFSAVILTEFSVMCCKGNIVNFGTTELHRGPAQRGFQGVSGVDCCNPLVLLLSVFEAGVELMLRFLGVRVLL